MQGNVILTDANYEILTLLRSHRDDNKGISFMARHAYPIHSIRLHTPLEMGQLQSALETADDKQNLRGETLYSEVCLSFRVQQGSGLRCSVATPQSLLVTDVQQIELCALAQPEDVFLELQMKAQELTSTLSGCTGG